MLKVSSSATNLMRRTARGFTLTELAIVLGIFGMVLAAIWVAAAKVKTNNRVQRATAQIQLIASGYQALWASRGIDVTGQWTDVTCMGVNAGIFPNDMVSGTCTATGGMPQSNGTLAITNNYPQTPWGQSTFAWVQVWQDNNVIDIGFSGLSQSDCVQFANAVFASPDMIFQNIYTISGGSGTRGGNFIAPYGASTGENGPPWPLSTIESYCAANGNYVEVGFKGK